MRNEAESGGPGDSTDWEQLIGEALVRAGQAAAVAESLTGGRDQQPSERDGGGE